MKHGPLPITLRQLQYITTVARTANFREAADICLVSQPALSAQLAEAESALGVRLFDRGRGGVIVTAAGDAVIERAERVLLEIDDLIETARRSVDPLTGPLKIGAIPTIAPYLLANLDPALRANFPSIELLWTEDKTHVLAEMVSSGLLDAAIMARESDLGDLDFEEIGTDPFVLAVPRDHALARRRTRARITELCDHHVLLLDDGHCFRDQALELCTSAGIQEYGFRATSLATLTQMVAGGRGVTLLPSMAVELETLRHQIVVRRLANPVPSRTIILAWRRDCAIAESLRLLAKTARDAYRQAYPARRG